MKYYIDYEKSSGYFSMWTVILDNAYTVDKLIFTTDPHSDTVDGDSGYKRLRRDKIYIDKDILIKVFEKGLDERFRGEWSTWL